MDQHEPLSTAKFRKYREELLQQSNSSDKAEVKRATYELALMEKSCFIEVNGIVHHYHDSGPKDAARTVLLIHGWDCWWMWWHYVINYLNERGIRTIAYDMRGHGWSDNDPDNHYHIDFFAHDLHDLVIKLQLGKFHIAAFSFGPFVALDYARFHPELIQSMTFFNFGYLPNSAFIQAFATNTITFVFNNLLRKLTWWLPAYMFARLVLAKNTILLHDILIGFKSLGLCAPEAIDQTTRQITAIETTESVPEMVKAVDIPILFVAGEGDAIMTCENTKKLVELTHRGNYVEVPECGHLITVELPETASELIFEQVEACSGH
ncbi:alpha/beta fold hydrolase [Chlorobium phaeobacteroides]|jgi:pimeloyl-ACP methyl ester carboxylesterase|uniref:Alpha/beta hydrolase fold protein n=1 Tax=Chlorobium phaeobacteroides (strain DSM 266 / SMG 266 / 2430) TaxID=290317 RepID=A1BEZ0_CHLPD|nr:alpha/beta hydrolase [Chlorobium phaeobacteroides]ABL64967.1 alpha/beta hydrolase fold protein [Chlorobium phaeobacteroides DSM 266]MBV5329300.1 alpha/beta hydrolase [Chlorobium sp.]